MTFDLLLKSRIPVCKGAPGKNERTLIQLSEDYGYSRKQMATIIKDLVEKGSVKIAKYRIQVGQRFMLVPHYSPVEPTNSKRK